jgi:8-oxo-dGTP pyrophosphatase MutT (NUDIX family)
MLPQVKRAQSITLESAGWPSDIVRAAGGIVARRTPERRLEVVVVHRPGRADWSFPKGKLDLDESFEECALREVLEETGLRCRLGRFAGHTEYKDRMGRQKVVAYWVMDVIDGTFHPNAEVDELRWVNVTGAAALLTYDRDRELLFSIAADDDAASL